MTGCLLQVYKICDNYFSYKTNTFVKYEEEVILSLPAITICIDKNYLIKSEHLDSISENGPKITSFNDSRINEYLNGLTVKQQFNAIYSAKDIFNDSCKVLKPNVLNYSEIFVDCEKISPIRQSIDYYQSCFTFISQLNGEPDDRYVITNEIRIKTYWKDIFYIDILPIIPMIRLFIHSREEMIIDSFEDNMEKIFYVKDLTSFIKYNKKIVQLMPKPYQTSCVDYKLFGYRSRYDCLLKCRINFLKKEYNRWPGTYLTDQLSDDYMIDILSHINKNQSLDFLMGKNCSNACELGNDCFKQYFSFKEFKDLGAFNNNFCVSILRPDLPDLSFTHLPKVEFEEFICFAASIVSLWFGFSVFMLSDFCLLVINHFNKIFKITKVQLFIVKNILFNFLI